MSLKKLIELALKEGATEAEVFCSKARLVNVETQRGSVGFAEESASEGLGIRVVAGGALGFSSVNDPRRYEDAVRAAVRCARARGPDPSLKGLPRPGQYRAATGIYDRRLEELSLDECIDMAAAMVAEAKKG